MKIITKIIPKTEYMCPVCGQDYDKKEVAEKCLKLHMDTYKKKVPKYKVGMRVKVSRYLGRDDGGPYHRDEIATIREIRGELFNTKLLVENSSHERYWVDAIEQNSLHFRSNNFKFVPIAR